MENEKIMQLLKEYVANVDDDWNYIFPAQLEVELKGDNDIFLLDVRRPEDFQKSHIKGAVNIFWLELLEPENLKKLPRDKEIIIVCYVGHSASQTLVMLRLLGYNAFVLKYGMGHSSIKGVPISGWLNLNYDVVSDEE